jgi:hypothetical protein
MWRADNPKNRFGYYSSGTFRTYSKFEAMDHAMAHDGSIKWHFNEDSFSQVPWTHEPPQSLETLYRIRAQQIRDRYDYVVLMYSGGIDSTNMVRVFFENNVLPDEICSVHEHQGTDNKHAFLTGEIFHSALPYVNANVESRHHTKMRIVDSARAQYQAVESLTPDSITATMYHWNVAHNLGNLARFDVRRLVPEYKHIIDSGRSLCLVWAECKPRIDYNSTTGRHQVHFNESGFDMICNAYHQDTADPTRHDELFYTTPDMPEIVAKQCHLLLNLMRNPVTFSDIMTNKSIADQPIDTPHAPGFKIDNPLSSMIVTYRNQQWWCMKPAVVNQTVYAGTDPVIYNQGKNVDRLIHPRDQWIRDKLPAHSRQFYTEFARFAKRYQPVLGNVDRNQRFGLVKTSNGYDLESIIL